VKQADVVIVGGSAAGPVAGITVRRHYKDKSVILIRKEEQAKVMVPCGIPYIFGTVGSPDKNVIPDALLSNNGIELIIDEAVDIDREAKTLKTAKGESVSYGKLILAIGSLPSRPPIPGMELENVFPVWKEAAYLANVLSAIQKAKDVIVIGGGFIGAETADECKKIGHCNVTIVEMLPHCLMLALDAEFAAKAEDKLKERGINIITDNGVKAILGDGKVSEVELRNGDKLKADVVIVGIGAVPNNELAKKTGLKIGELGGIWVDSCQKTSDEDIFAVGDCAEKTSFFTGRPSAVRLASVATNEARIAGANIEAPRRKNPGVIGVFATAFGDYAVASAGLTEKAATDAGYDVVATEAAAPDRHPGCIPDASEIKVKLIFDRKTQKLLGGEISGGTSTAELTNVIAMAIQTGLTAEDVALFQMGTHPLLTASPIVYPLVNAAEMALTKMGVPKQVGEPGSEDIASASA
jgi:NADPH-dependent 2,4-dienoyl-CoA reductase/sulfur reductase-like enzyme